MSALLLVEVIDTAGVILDAILWWILVAGFVATVCVYTAVLTGAWAIRGAWRALSGHLPASQPPEAPEFIPTPERPTAPSWARHDHDHQEAA